jgi:hypothetical protein
MFGETFLTYFVPTKVLHEEPKCINNYCGVPWTINEKNIIIDEVRSGRASQNFIASYLHVNKSRIEKIIRAKKDDQIFYDDCHRPSKVDEEGKVALMSAILTAKHAQKPVTKSECVMKVMEATAATDFRRGGNGKTSIGRTAIKTLLDNINVSFEQGQTITQARHRERKDIRNFVSIAALNEALVKENHRT